MPNNLSHEGQNSPEPRPLRTEWDMTPIQINGVKVLAVLPVVPEGATPEAREAIARRRIVMLEGTCVCGAIRRIGVNRAARRAAHRKGEMAQLTATIVHESDCVASDKNLYRLGFRGWSE